MPYVIKEKTGTAGKLLYQGVSVVFKHWTCKGGPEYANSTDSKNYDPVTGLTWRSQLPGDAGLEGMIEGYYDLNGKTASFVAAVFTNPTPQPAEFWFDQTTRYCAVNIDLTDFETGVETDGATTIPFTCNWKSNGIPTFQAPVAFSVT